jgi:polyhydroxybutyrate depolymerase
LTIVVLFLALVGALVASILSGRESIVVDGRERVYYIHLPQMYDGSEPTPLLLAFHMRLGTAWMMREITQFNRVADREGFIVVYPEGSGRSWADGSQRYGADKAGVDDVRFVEALLARLEERYSVDADRVYAAGFSNGGFFAQRLGCELSEKIAAIATVSAVLPVEVLERCAPAGTVPVLMMHGSADMDMPWEGWPPELASVPDTVEKWLEVNGCSPSPTVELSDPADDATTLRLETYTECRDAAAVLLYTIEGGGHKWPGASNVLQYWLSGNLSQDIEASSAVWEFFERHPKR